MSRERRRSAIQTRSRRRGCRLRVTRIGSTRTCGRWKRCDLRRQRRMAAPDLTAADLPGRDRGVTRAIRSSTECLRPALSVAGRDSKRGVSVSTRSRDTRCAPALSGDGPRRERRSLRPAERCVRHRRRRHQRLRGDRLPNLHRARLCRNASSHKPAPPIRASSCMSRQDARLGLIERHVSALGEERNS